ncbi:HAD family hydrolase [Salinilacihabitans rarus]|uniref:HAD family hydrolase n=1 Tax=Salinilacihabitans rarus TaxID=2961596 RepID=UPI0020C8850B|nr:HAD family hydrolase [Salinilacihabitans rarus]
MSPRAICFDLDHTLCEPTRSRGEVLDRAFSRAGVDPFCGPADFRNLVPQLPTAGSDREFYTYLFEAAADRAGADAAVAPALADAYLETVDPTAVRFCDGARAALDRAREVGPVGLITNGGRETQTKKLETLDIADAFDVTVFTDPADGVHPKPDPAPFERALSGLGVDPTRTVHVGDSLHADVAGANAMGMHSAWIDRGHGPRSDHEPTYELTSLAEFETIV